MRRFYTAAILLFVLGVLLMPVGRSFFVHADNAVSEGEKLTMYSKPAVVRIYTGPEGTFVYRHLNGEVRSYPGFQHVVSGSGFFISSDGYIVTNAHVTKMFHDGEEKAKEFLVDRFIFAAGKAFYNIEPSNMTREQYYGIRNNIVGLNNFNLYHVVVIPDGTQLTYEDKPSGYGAPTGETENAKDVSVIKVEVHNAPVLLLGDSDAVKVSDTDTVIGYPGVADFDEFKGFMSPKSALEATFTYGHISARKNLASGALVLQTDANIDHGNSGGPVLSTAIEVIGLATFGKDSQHSFVVTSNSVKEFVKAVGAENKLGDTDKLYREGLDLYWQQHYKEAMPKFEEVKRLFPQHSEINGLIQKSQQAITEGKDKSGLSGWWWIIIILGVLFVIVAVIVIAVVVFLVMRKRGKTEPAPARSAAASARAPSAGASSPKPPPYTPTPSPSAGSAPARAPYSPPAADAGRTVDMSATVAISREGDTSPVSFGSIQFVSGVLNGQKFEIKPEGCAIGRDGSLSQIVIADPRISKRHLWIGVRDGRVAITDEGSRNGTFLNDPKSPRITEAFLSPGDTVILGESDVARFEYQM